MSLPDSGWFTVVRKAEWWLVAAVATTAAVVLALAHFNVSWFADLPATVAAGTAIVGVLAFFLLVFKCVDEAWIAIRNSRASRVRRRAKKLSQEQREFLMSKYSSGSRSFTLPASFGSPRWLEELQNWNYIKWHSPLMLTPDSPDYFSITEAGWRELDKWHRKSH